MLQTDAKPKPMSCIGIGFGIICLLLPLVVAMGLAVAFSGSFNTRNSPQAAALLKSQQIESLREAQSHFAELNKKQDAKYLATE